jgi:asparagine synthase (glutamine-hydrolysing)
MCGIAGFVSSDRLDLDAPRRVARMRDVITHRGPDDCGSHCDAQAALGHRRLSIVDLRNGQQPLSNERRDVWVIFNGEIYNHALVRRELESRGHVYRTRSDTETIVHAYEEWGDECVDRFNGMFAFAVWDQPRRRLLLARDRLGIKPLYWAHRGNLLLFGSEIKAILASGLVEPEARLSALPEFFATRSTAGAKTLYAGILKLLPGHRLVFENGDVHISQYWDVPVGERNHGKLNASDVVAEFSELLTESVRRQLMSDVPLGVFLSGGLDSSAIAATMARLRREPIETFSVAFEEQSCSELSYSRAVTDAIGARRHEVVVTERDFFDALPRLVWHEDEPIAHPSSVPLYFVSSLARRHVTVVLTGEGSDELLAGYARYPRIAWNWRAGALYERAVPAPIRSAIANRVIPGLPERLARYARRSFLADQSPEGMVFDSFGSVRLAEQQALVSPALRENATAGQAYAASLAYFERPGKASTLLDRLLYADIKTYLVELLMKQDQMSMAASIESRVPFLDHTLVEFAARLPDAWKLSGWTTKRVLREAMKSVLPETILNRSKMGFPVPLQAWTRGRWNGVVSDVLLDRRSRERGIIDPPAVARLLRDHAAGSIDATDRIWSLLNLEIWFRTFIDKGGVQTLSTPRVPSPHANSLAEV